MLKNNLRTVFYVVLLLMTVHGAAVHAMVWIDEGFEDGAAFAPDGGGTGTLSDGIDLYIDPDWVGLTDPLANVLTHNGSIFADRSFMGIQCYKLDAGQSVAVGTPYSGQGGGSHFYLQFAASVEEIPAPGTMASLHCTTVIENVTYTPYFDFVSDGSKVDIVAGEDTVGLGSATVGTINDRTEWEFLTLLSVVNAGDTDSRLGLTGISQGLYYYVSNVNAALIYDGTNSAPNFPGTQDGQRTFEGWSLVVNDGTLYIDEVYWEGGFSDGDIAFVGNPDAENIRDLDFVGQPRILSTASSVDRWRLFE